MRFFTLFAIVTGLSFTPLQASDWKDTIDMTRADLSMTKLVLMNEGQPAGRMEYVWHKAGTTYVIDDLTEMQPNIFETARGIIDADTYQSRSIDINFKMGENAMITDLDWEGNIVRGTYTTKRSGASDTVTPIEAEVTAPLRLATFGLIAGLPLEAGFQTRMTWHNVMGGKLEDINVMVAGEETIDTPAGAFETIKVKIANATPENIIYFTKDLPRKIVRIDVIGQPIVFLRTN